MCGFLMFICIVISILAFYEFAKLIDPTLIILIFNLSFDAIARKIHLKNKIQNILVPVCWLLQKDKALFT